MSSDTTTRSRSPFVLARAEVRGVDRVSPNFVRITFGGVDLDDFGTPGDVYDARIKVPKLLEEATSMGAAVAGGVGVGLFRDFDAIERFIEIDCEHAPNPNAVKAYASSRQTFEMCYEALTGVYAHMARG